MTAIRRLAFLPDVKAVLSRFGNLCESIMKPVWTMWRLSLWIVLLRVLMKQPKTCGPCCDVSRWRNAGQHCTGPRQVSRGTAHSRVAHCRFTPNWAPSTPASLHASGGICPSRLMFSETTMHGSGPGSAKTLCLLCDDLGGLRPSGH
jgi:hypothetical protein